MQSHAHRSTCHRCGNVRKDSFYCTLCPYIFCTKCKNKMVTEHGEDAFEDGCPVCHHICCCYSRSRDCQRIFHCYKKCPAVLQRIKPLSSGFFPSPPPLAIRSTSQPFQNLVTYDEQSSFYNGLMTLKHENADDCENCAIIIGSVSSVELMPCTETRPEHVKASEWSEEHDQEDNDPDQDEDQEQKDGIESSPLSFSAYLELQRRVPPVDFVPPLELRSMSLDRNLPFDPFPCEDHHTWMEEVRILFAAQETSPSIDVEE